MYLVNEREALDIDYPADFAMAKRLLEPLYFAASDGRSDILLKQAKSLALDVSSVLHISFDLDGVLVDSIKLMEMSWEDSIKKCDLDIPFELYRDKIGLPFEDILKSLHVPVHKREKVTQCYEAFSITNSNIVRVYPDTIASLKVLSSENIKLSVVTSKSKRRAIPLIKDLLPGISFCSIICPEDIPSGRGKPCPDPILLACMTAEVDPSKSIYVGDMLSDLEAASRAGVPFVFADWGYSSKNLKRTNWFATLHDFSSYITSIKEQ